MVASSSSSSRSGKGNGVSARKAGIELDGKGKSGLAPRPSEGLGEVCRGRFRLI